MRCEDIKIISEQPAIILKGGSSFDGGIEEVYISFPDIRRANIGKKWKAVNMTGIGRGEIEQEATLLYKDDKGALIRVTTWETSDTDNPIEEEYDEYYIIEFL